jgi:hypothetical protein
MQCYRGFRNAIADFAVKMSSDTVHNGFGDRAVVRRNGVNPLVPSLRFVLDIKDGDAVVAPDFENLQQVVRFPWIEAADQPLIKDQQINLLVTLNECLLNNLKT